MVPQMEDEGGFEVLALDHRIRVLVADDDPIVRITVRGAVAVDQLAGSLTKVAERSASSSSNCSDPGIC